MGTDGYVIHIHGRSEAQDFDGFVAAATQIGDDVLYDAGGDGRRTILIEDVQLSDLTEDHFLFG